MAVVPPQAAYIVANYKETQLTDVRAGQTVEIEVDMFPGQRLRRPCRQPRAGERPGIRPAAARQRHRQLHQGGPAHPGEDRARRRYARLAGVLRPGMSVYPTIDTKADRDAHRLAADRAAEPRRTRQETSHVDRDCRAPSPGRSMPQPPRRRPDKAQPHRPGSPSPPA